MFWPLHFRASLVPATVGPGARSWFPHMAVPRLGVSVRNHWSCQLRPWPPWVRAAPSRFLCPFLKPFPPRTTQSAGSGAQHGCHQRKEPWACWALGGLCLRRMLPALFLAGSDPSTLLPAVAGFPLGNTGPVLFSAGEGTCCQIAA